ncbi:MAG: dihydroorotate dehydrogenase electron transfer subunit [Streptococcus hyointestinalis]|uniref:dihydroorotate dehydrogenase electron transfer subunit n=1 Tax=Streptococcus hyointestinalis TaxID=1337 RepID=UPI0023F3BDB1|nr:dihydroorotate dehydrogenase electron transfer subunit [Streptococcus hyointestinalis]MCI6872219.1 dihydroorotate dehydrogenase electron transfer subunit [Streptococcus hyointestinalis]MDD7355587.1 dihydroorotate dehydrogenase electron transfer subunit [Streptococcus hyointestinalis]MDY4553627.1 dihydroorotate dehydrogenase electron transfer subunit [Streptococcus hyointestinalis]
MLLKENMTIVSQSEIAPRIYEMVLRGDLVEQMTIGQFLHIRVPDASKLLRRPISISQVDKEKKEATLVYRIEGAGTEIFSQLSSGDSLDCMGPQGNGFSIDFLKADDTALIVGGGIGVPPLVELAKQLHERGVSVTAVLGFANKDAVILEEELARYADVIVTTDDGSYGIKGYVSTVIDEMTQTFDAVYACGAPGMLVYVDRKFEKHPHAYISMESRMACGMGACYACVVHLRDQSSAANKRVCEDGPVFETGSIILE